jgi:tetratricopeptide (TPR) repeat protein
MNNLATAYRAAGKLDRALPLFEESFRLHKARLGADHPHTLASMNNLAMGYQAARKPDRALPLFEESFRLHKARLGADHYETLGSMNNLATAYRAARKPDRALPLFEESFRLHKAALGADHPRTLASMNNLAMSYRDAKKLDRALLLQEESFQLHKARLGADHPDTLVSMNNLAMAYRAARKPDLALPLIREAALGVEKRRFAHEHARPIVANLIGCHEQLEQFDQAAVWRRKWLAVVKAQSGADSAAYAGELAALGSNLLLQHKWTEAETVLRAGLAIREKKEPGAWTTFEARSLLGGALLGQKKYAAAEPLLLAGYEGLKKRQAKIPPRARFLLVHSLARLVQLYDALEKKDESAKWRKELQSLAKTAKQPTDR